ncbi:MAG: hypothetical protein IJB86_02465 [Clostridia bacterium]|nr:hypothetical protein [Clostridia bacterium]
MNDFKKIIRTLSFTNKMLKVTRILLFASMGIFVFGICKSVIGLIGK